ncbi:MAG TPA: PAS domain S-box protein [Chloroflexota bacterium]|nr:PAS domain S-box protein [Chloroflexota bacterium]HUM67435.1 PAS domain S-box protein [Chloroflexota bacterium]
MSQIQKKETTEKIPYQVSEELYRTLFEQAADGIFITNEKGEYIEVNHRGCEMLGYTREELLCLSMQDLIPPADLAHDPLQLNKLRTGGPRLKERRLRCKNGHLLHVEISGQTLADGTFLAITRDITERKQVERELQRSNDLLQAIIKAAPVAIVGLDLDGNVQMVWNPAAENMLGWSAHEVMGRPLPSVPNQSQEEFSRFRERIQCGKTLDGIEVRRQRRDGSPIDYSIYASPLHDAEGQITGNIAVLVDITRRKEAENELRRTREAALQFSERLAALQDITNQLSKATSTDNLCRDAVLLGRSHLAFDRIGIWFIDEHLGIMRGSFGTDENGELRDERDAQVEFRREGLAWQVFSQMEATAIVEPCSLYDHQGQKVGQGENAVAALWDGGKVVGIISIDNFFSQQPITNNQLELLRLYATTLGHLITRKRAEEALRASELRFSTLVDHATDAFFLHDADGAILDVNRQACESLGYSREELLTMTPHDFDVAHDPVFIGQMRAKLDTGEVISFDTLHRRKDGSVFPVEIRVRPLWQGKRRFGVSLARDMTRRKQAETALRQRETQLQHIIDTVPEGVLLLDDNGRIQLTNPVAEHYLAALAPDREDDHLTHLGQRPLNELLTSPPKGLWHEIADDAFVFEAIARPVENSTQNAGWVLVLRDVTQERNIQRRAQQQERLAAVGQLAAGIAHDFNNILAVIVLYTQLISRTVEMPARSQERLQIIEQQTNRAADLIQQILDFSRQSVLERQAFDLLPFTEKLVALLDRTLPENIQVELEHTGEAYFIQADSTRIQQVIMNLAVNARDAMPEGGQLHIRLAHRHTTEPKPMPLHDLPPGNWVQIEVADSGGGIPPEALPHIFEPFFTTKEVGQGTGLGLAQVYGIVQQHEGYIDVTTQVGQGTSFFLYFPAIHTGDDKTDKTGKDALPLGQGQRILLVEDNVTTREALLDSLTLLNYEVITATNGREALALLTTKAADVELVLSDAVMPEMGGVALYHAMCEQNLTIPVVLLTGHPLSKEMENLQKLGLAGWLPKPPDLTNLSYLLANVLTAS